MNRRINYRKIYKEHFGKIPKDNEGRSYDIHHKDGNKDNNDPENLIALSLQEHYDTHFEQEDWGACWAIGKRMEIRPETFAEIVRKHQIERLAAGTHNFKDPNFKRSYDHNIGYVVAIDTRNGETVRVLKEEFDNNDYYVGSNTGRKQKIVHMNRGYNKGKTWKQKTKRSNIVTCPHCGKSGDASGHKRWHFDNCKMKGKDNE